MHIRYMSCGVIGYHMSTEAVTSFDTYLDALQHVDRRRLFLEFQNTKEATLPIEFGQLEYATAESDALASFYHNHLPKLEARRFVDANPD